MPDDSSAHSSFHEAEERFQLLVESVTDYAIFMLEPDGRVATWNSGAQRLKRYSAKEIIGRHFSTFYSAEDIAAGKPEQELSRAASEGRAEDEGWRLRKDGSRFWAYVVLTAMRDRHGKLIGFAKVTRDLTERRAAEERLRANEEEFRMLIERVQEYAIYMLGPTGLVVTWNSGAEKIKQYTAQEIIGKSFTCFYTAEDVAAGKPQRNLQEAARLGHIREQGLRVRKDGSYFEADVVITALRDRSGTLRGFSKVTRDISDQVRSRQLEAEKMAAEQSSKAKDAFLAALSHELRTPLTPALAAASFLAENASRIPSEFGFELDVIRRNVELEARLIDDLLDLTRISAGKIALHPERVDAHNLAREAIKIARPDMDEKGLSLVEDWSASAHHLYGDPVRIQQVFWNVINNAVKFTGTAGQIIVRTWNEENRFVLEVVDNGIGIEPERQARLFEAFEQGDTGVTRQFGGLGLGLAICKSLVELHHGSIALTSRGRSFGTTVKITFEALSESSSTKEDSAPAPGAAPSCLRILLVEDHADTRRVLARLLTHSGHKLSIAENVEGAMQMLRSTQFDVVLSDLGLPDGTGRDVMVEAKRLQDLKGVALSGYGMSEDVRRSEEAGFDFHLTKPVDFAQLRSVLAGIELAQNGASAPNAAVASEQQ
jgi:PAS domain S-box-containing protein